MHCFKTNLYFYKIKSHEEYELLQKLIDLIPLNCDYNSFIPNTLFNGKVVFIQHIGIK